MANGAEEAGTSLHPHLILESREMLFPKVLRVVYPLAGRYCTKRTFATGGPVLPASVGHLDSQSPPIPSPRTQKKEGTIEDVFSFNTSSAPLPQRFSQLKKDIFHLDLTKCWEEVLSELDVVTKHVAKEREKVTALSYSSGYPKLSRSDYTSSSVLRTQGWSQPQPNFDHQEGWGRYCERRYP